jgi:hypothetical protein
VTLIEILFNHVRKTEPEACWETEGHAFIFPITDQQIGRVWVVVRQEAGQIFIGVGLVPLDVLGDYIGCVSEALLRENGDPDAIIMYAIISSLRGTDLLGIRTFLDYHPNNQGSQTYIARFNSRYDLIRRDLNGFDGLLKRLLDECGGD